MPDEQQPPSSNERPATSRPNLVSIEGERGKRKRKKEPPAPFPTNASIEDFYAYPVQNACIYMPTGDLWPSAYVDKRMLLIDGMKASKWLARYREVQQMTWAPGEPKIIKDKLVDKGGWRADVGRTVYNLYRPPPPCSGDPAKAQPWVDHVSTVYPDTCDHVIRWLAHGVQFPNVKINHALFLGGLSGVGKDTLLVPAFNAVGDWNTRVVSPTAILERFNGFLQSRFLLVSEVRDLGEFNRYQFYERMKLYLASPPLTITIDEKNLRAYAVPNLVNTILTSNNRDAIPLTEDDRRYHCNWCDLSKLNFDPGYFDALYKFYAAGGLDHVAAYLLTFDLQDFNPKAPPPLTEAFWSMVNAGRAPEFSEMADVLEALSYPPVVYLDKLKRAATAEFQTFLNDRTKRKQVPKRLAECGYVPLPNPNRTDDLWKVEGKSQVIYYDQRLTRRDAIVAVTTIL